ncbi:hypothetical protein WJX81_006868 [Elliptochloris bilobata]|uniref:Uncharacterized protein n=1 Tax=Elliptochloris bilobata TaxID=381761 RepID=A0AAW1RT99_9CHLO
MHTEAAGRDSPDQTHEDQPSSDSGDLGKQRRERKKGVAWTEEEHIAFLAGLRELGKGQWREIAKHFVPSRTSTQVASHAQKHFIRQADGKRKRRSSLFDLQVPDGVDSTTSAKRHQTVEPAAPSCAIPPAAEQLALQQMLMAGPAALLQAQAAGLGGMLPGGFAGFPGFLGYAGVDTLLGGQAFLPQMPYGLPFGLPSQQAAALLFAQQQQQAAYMMAAAAMPCPAASLFQPFQSSQE